MDTDERLLLQEKLAKLKQKHRTLDEAIDALGKSDQGEPLQLKRLKKKKLTLKDEMSRVEDLLLPDIIA